MSAFPSPSLLPFAADVAEGLTAAEKYIDPRYLFDDVGLSLFQIAAKLPEFGVARAEQRILNRYSSDYAKLVGPLSLVGELGRGNHQAQAHLFSNFSITHFQEPGTIASPAGSTVPADWLKRADQLLSNRPKFQPALLTLLGGAAGTADRSAFFVFLCELRQLLRPGDYFLFGIDLIKDIDKMVAAYQDAAGIISAFNKNLLSRINREVGGRIDLQTFRHGVAWNTLQRCVELRLISSTTQDVYIGALGRRFHLQAGEAIRTLRDYKYSEMELEDLVAKVGLRPVKTRIDLEWAFADVLWSV